MQMTAEEAYAEAERRIKAAASDVLPDIGLSDLKNLNEIPKIPQISKLVFLNIANTNVTSIEVLAGAHRLEVLDLDQTSICSLEALSGLDRLVAVYMNGTKVSDIRPLQTASKLKILWLADTEIEDISPLTQLASLHSLLLSGSKVNDLRPIVDMVTGAEKNRFSGFAGLQFENTPAATSNATLRSLSRLEDDHERTDKTLAYLRTLPPYPEPLPWDLPKTPPADQTPRVIVTNDQIDIAHVPADASDLDDPIKSRLYSRLKSKVPDLIRLGNVYPEVNAPAQALNTILATPFEEADLLDIHLEMAVLTDLIALNPSRTQAEQLDAECLQVVQQISRLGPPLTLGNPDVELFEARSLQYAQQKRDEAIANSERAMAQALIDSPLLTARAAHFADIARTAPLEGRTASYRTSYVKNVILLGIAALTANTATTVWTTETVAALEFLQVNKDLVLTIATSWGEQGHIWAADLIARSGEALRKYRA
ncbi:hypothetical protein [uncultured Sulfitobacter sp.]|uniref:hypothetical protein n=1 Tax=uncultured Sulfitobacter sp. TaxID=191468 RepID=UPI002605C85C|nr:hypothetical protein [uncultured Sulfitobacter sp.]